MFGADMELFFLWLILCVLVGVWASKKGRSGIGAFLFSLFLSPLVGAIIVALMKPEGEAALPRDELGNPITPATHVHCPDCRELVRKEARKCKHCGSALMPQ
ncbi:hypothetical protein [Delftia tsuruhatensis]|uniref:hypothetical protein n=2 Tax=Delftia TaxID=80865 RepID=UPI00289A678F|nr:hypothetical protein [Delftia tsuruhatensis]